MIKKLWKAYSRQNDKVKHLQAGFAISLIVGIVSPLWGFLIASIIGALKEIIWDWLLKKGTPEFLDFVATCAGGLIGFILLKLI